MKNPKTPNRVRSSELVRRRCGTCKRLIIHDGADRIPECLTCEWRRKHPFWWCDHIEHDTLGGTQWRMSGGDWKKIPANWNFCPFCSVRKPKLPMGRPPNDKLSHGPANHQNV